MQSVNVHPYAVSIQMYTRHPIEFSLANQRGNVCTENLHKLVIVKFIISCLTQACDLLLVHRSTYGFGVLKQPVDAKGQGLHRPIMYLQTMNAASLGNEIPESRSHRPTRVL